MKHSRRVTRRSWLQFESMEPRNLLAVYNVQLNAAPGGDGSTGSPFATIAAAVAAASSNVGADEILVGPGSYAESISIFDSAGLTIRGDAAQRPTLRGIGLVQPNENFVFENLNIVSSASGFFVDNANRPFVRAGSISLNNMNIQVPTTANSWNNISITGLNQFTANNIVLTTGRVLLNDVNTAYLSQITVNQSRTNALSANFVSQLFVNGLTSVQPFASGVALTNPTRTYSGVGTRPVNEQSVVNLSGVQITASNSNGLEAGANISLTVMNSAFNSNGNMGASLTFVTSTVMENVQTNSNATGIFLSREGTFSGRNLVSRLNRVTGFNASTIGAVSIDVADFSSNSTHGFTIEASSGPVTLRTVRASSNGQWGGQLTNVATNVSLSDITTNSNGRVGLTFFRSSTNTVFSNVTFNGGQSIGNSLAGIELIGLATLNLNNVTATDNGGVGLVVSQVSGATLIANSQFHRNSTITTTAVRAGTNLIGLKSGLTLTNVSANNNPIDGIIVDNALGSITASGITASGNPFTGLYVNNASQAQRAALILSDSSLSGNGKNGLLAVSQSRVSIVRSHFDNNGPAASQSVDYGTGAWIANTGTGGVIIEDSTAIGTRVGVQSGAGIQVVNATGPEVQVRRVTIADTLVHPLTTTNFGAGLVVLGNITGARVEDSTFSRNSLLDSIASRAVIFTTVPLIVVRSQFLDNAGVSIQATQTLSLQDSTIARTTGTGISIGGGGTILRSTISGNTPAAIVSNGPLLIDQSTLTGNATTPTASTPPMVIQNTDSLILHNSIVAGNGPESWAFSNSALTTSTGFNLLSGTPVGWVGLAADIVGDLNNRINPGLSVLENFGGPTLTHMPLAGSPALETGDTTLNGARDQRGQLRPLSLNGEIPALPDMGAVEASDVSTAPAILLNSPSVAGMEGSQLTLRGRVTDFDGNLASLTAGLGSVQLNADGTFVWTFTAVDDLSTTVQLTATDALGGVGIASFTVDVSNVAPVLGATNSFANGLRTVTLQTSVSDLGLSDSHLFTIQWGDGTSSVLAPDANRRLTAIHQYASVDSYVLSVFATDDDGARTATVSRVVNVAPVIVLNATSISGNEGSRLQVTGRINDPDGIDNRISASLGSLTFFTDGSFTWTFDSVDDLNTTVLLTASDAFGAIGQASFALVVNNVAPIMGTIDTSINGTARSVDLQASLFDVGPADTHQFTINWGDGSSTNVAANANRTIATSHQYSENAGAITISIFVTDDDGGRSSITSIPVNAAPSIQLNAIAVSGSEGSPLSLTGSAADPNLSLPSVTASMGLVKLNDNGTFVWTLTPADNISTNVVLTATDVFGATASASFALTVANVAPTLGSLSATTNAATRTVNLQSSVFDPGSADTHQFTIQWGDGTSSVVAAAVDRTLAASHQYAAVGPITISVYATDDDGADTQTSTIAINVSPTIQLDIAAVTGSEGDLLTLTGRAADPDGNLSTLAATLGTVQLNADGTFAWTFMPSDNLNTNVVLTATDAFGAVATASFTVNVDNLAPMLGATSATLNATTRTLTIQSSVTDPGRADTHVFTIQWGDGTSSDVVPATSGSVVAAHQYSVSGPITIAVKVRDDDGASSFTTSVRQVIPGFALRNRELFVYGSSQSDSISFNVQKRQPVVVNANFGGFATQFSFEGAAVDAVVGYLDDGSDSWSGASLATPQYIFGEAGNDQITTGQGADIVVGGTGADVLTANSGRDLIFGGLGADQLFGQDDSDVLVAGKFERENDLAALRMLLTAWLPSNSNYQTRVNRMRTGVGTDAVGNTVRLSIDLIADDAVDQLFGGKDSDWFLTNVASEIKDLSGGESRN